MDYLKRIAIGLVFTVMTVLLISFFLYEDKAKQPAEQTTDAAPTKAPPRELASASPPEPVPMVQQQDANLETGEPVVELPAEGPEAGGVDPVRLTEAELALVNNQIYEEVARETLPTLSVQTHNPVWALEYEMQQGKEMQSQAAARDSGPLPAPQSGPFGNIQPAAGEIWLRIPAENAAEHLDIMAENADLYRAETGYYDPLTVTLWVGGRVFARQHYE